MDGIQAQRTRHNEFVESGSKGWALTRQWLMQALEGDDRVGAKNTEVDGLTIRGNELPVRWYESPSNLICQEREGGICTPSLPRSRNPLPYWERSLTLYISFRFILILHLLVIHAHTWVHVSSATPSVVLWAVVTQIALSGRHVHINGVRMLAVGT